MNTDTYFAWVGSGCIIIPLLIAVLWTQVGKYLKYRGRLRIKRKRFEVKAGAFLMRDYK